MNRNQREIAERLDAMSIDDARKAVAFGGHDSPNQNFALSWLSSKEATARDLREEESLFISRKALRISERAIWRSTSAIILSIIMAIYEIMKLYS